MSDERNIEVYEIADGHDRYESMGHVLTLLPGDTMLPATGDVILLQAELPGVERNHQGRGVAYRVVEREFFYREERNVDPMEQHPVRAPITWVFVRRIPEAEYGTFSPR